LFHRSGLVKSFVVREANLSSDYTAVERLVSNIKTREKILYDLNTYLKSRKDPNGVNIQAFVAEALGRIVGVAIIRQEKVYIYKYVFVFYLNLINYYLFNLIQIRILNI